MSSLDYTASPESPYVDLQPAFVIGVTGNMDPVGYDSGKMEPGSTSQVQGIHAYVHTILDWVRGCGGRDLWLDGERKVLVDEREVCRPPDTPQAYHSCWRSLQLHDTPIILLSSLAPGIDTLVAEAALDYAEKRGANVRVRAALPFPWEQYVQSSSFVRKDPNGGQDKTQLKRVHALKKRLEQQPGFDAARDFFDVPLHPRAAGDPVQDLTANDPVTGKPRRYLRYRAAGEYVAAYSDLLLAFYDEKYEALKTEDYQDPFQCGSHAVVEAKRRGLTEGLLPIPYTISWADTGPVLHVPVDREKNKPTALCAAQRKWRLLQPLDALPEDVREADEADARWQENGDRLLRASAESLKDFATEIRVPMPELQDELVKLSPAKSLLKRLGQSDVAHDIAATCTTFKFDRYAYLRDVVAANSRDHDRGVKQWRVGSFLLGLGSLFLLLASGSDFKAITSVFFAHALELSPPESFFSYLSVFFFVCGLGLFGATCWWHHRFIGLKKEDRQFDYRLVAEGLRVQFYWSVSGLFASVASRYIQRLRGELNWIRGAISSVTFPYKRTQDWFTSLGDGEKLKLLRGVRTGWLLEQRDYFRLRSDKATEEQTLLKLWALTLFWAGVGFATYSLFLANGLVDREVFLVQWRTPLFCGSSAIVVSALLVGIARRCCYLWIQDEPFQWPGWRKGGWVIWLHFVPRRWLGPYFPTQEKLKTATRLWENFCLITLGLAVAVMFILIWPSEPTTSEEWDAWVKFFKALALSGSALLFLWIQANFLEEYMRSYGAMHELFRGAEQRMKVKLHLLEKAILSQLPQHEKNALVEDIQDLLLVIGQEALAENAEWVVMRRNRRIEAHRPQFS